jgi:ethanolamine ammonia-lyase small subunit
MNTRAPLPPSLKDLRDLTPARIGLGIAGASLPTSALLEFTLDHARARDAVHAVFDASAVMRDLGDLGLKASSVSSRAVDREQYLRRPDLGRMLDADSRQLLSRAADGAHQLAVVVGDGLSPTAVHAHAIPLLQSLIARLAPDHIAIGRAVVASRARVALGDEIGALLGARMVAVLIGERPGLSAADSLGVYLTFAPSVGVTDEKRNCVSNIHRAGLTYDEAAFKIAWLIREGLARELTGVALKDDSGGRMPRSIAAKSGPT